MGKMNDAQAGAQPDILESNAGLGEEPGLEAVKISHTDDQAWLEADLADLPPFDWGSAGPLEGKPMRFVPSVGLVVEGSER